MAPPEAEKWYYPEDFPKDKTIEESGVGEGFVLFPCRNLENWVKEHKRKHAVVGAAMAYMGDAVEVTAVEPGYGGLITINHNGQEKRTTLEKLQFRKQ